MKKITLFLFALLMCSLSAFSAQIIATDYDFGSVSIKGKSYVTDKADITVSWQGLTNIAVYAEVAQDSPSDIFFVDQDNNYFHINGYANTVPTSCTFNIGYYATAAGTYTGKIHLYSYDPNGNDVEKTITVSLTVTSDAIVAQTTPFARINSTSELKAGDIVVFVNESAGAVGGPLSGTYLPAVTQDVKVDAVKGEAMVPQTAQTFTLSQYNGNWQFTTTDTGNRMLLDISGKGAFSFGEPDKDHLAGWGISISNGVAVVSRPDDDQTFPVRFNTDRFKPYKSAGTGKDMSLYKKAGNAQDLKSSLVLDQAIDFSEMEKSEQKSVVVNYTAEYLTDDIVWAVEGTDGSLFSVVAEGNNSAGKLTISYNGKGTKTGALSARLSYLTQDIRLDAMEGSFDITATLVENTVKLTSLTFDNTSYGVNLGETLNLKEHLTLTPADAADKSLTWETSPKAYATIDENGVLTPLISGKVTVTVSSVKVPEVKTSCEVSITVPEPTGITIDPVALSLNIGQSATLVVNVLPTGANQTVTYSSDNTAVVTVSSKGLIRAVALGKATITIAAKDNAEIKTTCEVSVVPVTVESIVFDPATISLTKGFKTLLQPVVTPAAAANDNKITYKSDNEKVATVSETGELTAVEVGEATITAAIADKEAKLKVQVTEAQMFAKVTDASSLKDKDTIIIALKTDNYTVAAGPLTDKQLSALLDNVEVTDQGAAAEGAVELVLGATTGGFTLTPVGKTKALAENGNTFVEANTKNNKVWTFGADEKGVYIQNVGNTDAYVKYNPDNSYIRPYKKGSIGPVMMYVYVHPYIAPAVVHPTSVSLDKTSLTLTEGESATLVATVAPANAGNKKVSWSSSDEQVATVSTKGVVEALTAGTATITVTTDDGALTAQCAVTVEAKPEVKVTGVSLNKTTLSLEVGQTATLVATVTPADATDKTVTWSSTNEAVATVIDGQVKAIAAGEATIVVTTTDGALTAQCAVTVKEATTPVGDKGTENNPYTVAEVIALNNTQQVKAWVMGYIWGQPASGSSIKATADDDTSIALGDSEESDGSTFVPVQLPAALRADLGVKTNPSNVGRRVKVYGDLLKYFGVPGVKNTSDYQWLDTPEEPKEQTPVPSFSVEEGEVAAGTVVSIIGSKSDTIYARVAGGEWQKGMSEVKITVTAPVTIEAYAVRANHLPSDILSRTYTISTVGVEQLTDKSNKRARKVLRDQQIIIVLPDGSEVDAVGRTLR